MAEPRSDVRVVERIGEDGVARIVAAFYRRVPGDDVLGPLYPPQELAAAQARLRDFLIYRFGGSTRYLTERGHPRLRARHLPFAIDQRARDRWMQRMTEAIAECEVPADVAAWVEQFLGETATFLINRR